MLFYMTKNKQKSTIVFMFLAYHDNEYFKRLVDSFCDVKKQYFVIQ